jgi:hypothetical protein
VGAQPAYYATFPEEDHQVQVYIVGSEGEAEAVGEKVEALTRGFGFDNPEDYVVQDGNAVAAAEDAPASGSERAVFESCFG